MNKLRFKTVIILAFLFATTNLAGCGSLAGAEPSSTETIAEVSTTTETIEVTETSATESETEETTEFTYETINHSNPYAIDLYDYNDLASECYFTFYYGFDNQYSLDLMREYVYDNYDVYDDSLTLADFNYFVGWTSSEYNDWTFYKSFTDEWIPEYYIPIVRAVLISEGLRFGIDEIPYSYFAERFPQFINEDLYGAPYADPDEYATILPETIGCITLHDHNTYYYDLEIYCACITYNSCRMQYIYNNPTEASNILQVKDELTGKNILIPNDVQAELLQADINSLPCCENIDMYQVETEEDFYLSYGVSVQEILNSNLMYEPNKTAVAGVIEVEE